MTVSLTHTFQSAKPDGSDTALVQPSNWNQEHILTAAAGKVLGRDTSGAGAVQELPIAVTATGDVGIGTSSPTSKLAVAGIIESTTGGVKFPDGTTQTSAGGAVSYPQNIQSSNYTLILSDAGKHIYSANAGAQTLTIPTNASVAFPIGTIVTIVNFGTTIINLSVSGISVYPNGSTVVSPYPVIAVGAAVQILKTGTNTWASTFGILPSAKNSQVSYLSVAGGGGGGSGLVSGSFYAGGGGGAGGAVTGRLAFAVGTLTVTIGAGGAGNTGNGAGNQGGSTSVTGTTTAVGGGAGGGNTSGNGGDGGSGGGLGSTFLAVPGVATVNQGASGGGAIVNSDTGGGGGGASSFGGDGGYGGDGIASTITGTSIIYGGGGGGCSARGVAYASRGGAGGGGDGARASNSIGATAGTVNRGGGGGGGGGNTSGSRFNGGNGGSGGVIVSTPIAATSTTGSPTITTVGGDTIYQFNSSGSITW